MSCASTGHFATDKFILLFMARILNMIYSLFNGKSSFIYAYQLFKCLSDNYNAICVAVIDRSNMARDSIPRLVKLHMVQDGYGLFLLHTDWILCLPDYKLMRFAEKHLLTNSSPTLVHWGFLIITLLSNRASPVTWFVMATGSVRSFRDDSAFK